LQTTLRRGCEMHAMVEMEIENKEYFQTKIGLSIKIV
jgi:hypothetical protein